MSADKAGIARLDPDALPGEQVRPIWQVIARRLLVGRWRVPVVFSLLALVYILTSAPTGINDTRATGAAAWNVATYGTPDFRAAGFEEVWHQADGVDGQVLTNRFPGTYLVAVPLYLVTGATPVEDLSDVPFGPAGLTAALLVAGAVVLMIEVLRDVADPWTALCSGLIAGLATPVWSIAARALWTHTVGVFVLSLALWAAIRERWWLVGAAFGWAIFARPTFAVMAAVFGLLIAWWRRSWSILVAVGIPSFLGLVALSVYTHELFGTWLPVAGYPVGTLRSVVGAESANLGEFGWSEQVFGTFVHRYHGVIPYSLFLVPLVLAIPAGWRRGPDWARASLIAGLAYWAVQLRGNRFTGGFDFVGYRFPIDPLWLMVPILVVGWVAWRDRVAWRRLVQGTVAVSLGLMIALVAMTPNGFLVEPDSAFDGDNTSRDATSAG